MSDAWLVLVAAGQGTRLGKGEPKAFVSLCGRPLVCYSLEAAGQCDAIAAVVVAADEGRVRTALKRLSPTAVGKIREIVPGGETRRLSVLSGLRAVKRHSQSNPVVLVHDAARPFASPELLERMVTEAQDGAIICARPVVDTVKRVDGDQILETMPRENLALAQTPQAAPLDLLERAHAAAGEAAAGDDAVLIESLGETVRVFVGPSINFKITDQEDLKLAEAWVRGGGTPWVTGSESW